MADPFIGQIMMFGGNFAPQGWAFCNGQIMSIAQYAALYAVIGTTYGGNGQSTFALPDLRGRVPTGFGQGAGLPLVTQGQMAGTPSIKLTTAQLPPHNHQATFTGSASQVTATINVGTTHTAAIANPTNGSTTYLTAADASVAGDAVTINGLFSNTPPAAGAMASLNGGTTSVTPQGSVAVAMVGSGADVPITQPYLGVNFIIALNGIFPSRN